MADITIDSFVTYSYPRAQQVLGFGGPGPGGAFSKVLMQRGRDVRDSELNELQDNLRYQVFTTMFAGMQESGSGLSLNPGSNDQGFLCVGSGASNQLTLQPGTLFCDGIPLSLSSAYTFTGFTTAGGPRTDTVYLIVQEVEVADPSAVPQLGVTTLRRQVQTSIAVSTTGHGGVPSNSSDPVWRGGIHYFIIADVTRRGGDPLIQLADVVDQRFQLPPTLIGGRWATTCGDGTYSQGEFSGPYSIQQAVAKLLGLGATSIRLLLKTGTYTIDSTFPLNLPAGIELVVEGYGDQDTIVTFSPSGSPVLTTGNSCRIEFRYLFMSLVASGRSVDFSHSQLTLYQVTTYGMSFYSVVDTHSYAFGPNVVHAAHCKMFAVTLPALDISVTTNDSSGNLALYKGRITLVDSYLETVASSDTPFVKVAAGAGFDSKTLNAVDFIRCDGLWGYATYASNGSAHGNITGNPGPISFDPNGANLLRIDRVRFDHCHFVAMGSGVANTSAIVLRIVPFKEGDSAWPPAHGHVSIDSVEIEGGLWEVADQNTRFSSFTIVAGHVRISDFTLRVSNAMTGVMTDDLGFWITGATINKYGPGVFISAAGNNVVSGPGSNPTTTGNLGVQIDGFTLTNVPRSPSPPPISGMTWAATDVMILSPDNASSRVRNLHFADWNDPSGTDTGPINRVVFMGFGQAPSFVVDGLVMEPPSSTTYDYLDHTQTGYLGQPFVKAASGVTLRDCTVKGPIVAGSQSIHAAFAPFPRLNAPTDASYVVFDNCNAYSCGCGILLYPVVTSFVYREIRVTGGTYTSHLGPGIAIFPVNTTGNMQSISVVGASFIANGGPGINMDDVTDPVTPSLRIEHNRFDSNNGGAANVQLLLHSITHNAYATIFGNECGLGGISIKTSGSLNEYKGTETIFSYGNPGPEWSNLDEMIHNQAYGAFP